MRVPPFGSSCPPLHCGGPLGLVDPSTSSPQRHLSVTTRHSSAFPQAPTKHVGKGERVKNAGTKSGEATEIDGNLSHGPRTGTHNAAKNTV